MSRAGTGRLAIIEAMAAGLPVIAARTRHLGDEMDASRSVLVEAGDIGALVESILTLHRDPARAATLGAAGRAHAARFSSGPIAAEWEKIYGEVLARSRQPRTATPRAVVPQSTAPPS
jgi:glycosyltransferase involved in cell wall biosynthesis